MRLSIGYGIAAQAVRNYTLMYSSVTPLRWGRANVSYLVDPASSHMLVPKIKPCMSQYKLLYGETANGSLYQL